MNRTRIIGIDPGLVDTGVVIFDFVPSQRLVSIGPIVCPGGDVPRVVNSCNNMPAHIFIEKYRPRSHFDTDERMTALVRGIHLALPGSKVVDNTGVKQVITRAVMQALGVWQFAARTHHQDLRSAALIALYGMVKDDELNALLATFLRDYLDGKAWKVEVR